jgi:tRNA modification GTPase
VAHSDTIFALASGALPSGVAVIRISGPHAAAAAVALGAEDLAPRQASLRQLHDPADSSALDEGLVLSFPGPHSFTGEDVVELQVHGGRASVQAILDVLGSQNGLRPAEAGEFSRRAFENGRMDLTELEGLADLVEAETEEQRKLAFAQSRGALREIYVGWRNDLIAMRAMIEADLDFTDEEDVPDSVAAAVFDRVVELRGKIAAQLDDQRYGEIIRDGFRVALVGPPNAGKSTLLNNLAGRDVAIVSDVAGTTRDLVEAVLDIAGHKVIVTDTAGQRDTADPIEREGIRRAQMAAEDADLILRLGRDAPDTLSGTEIFLGSFGDETGTGYDMRSLGTADAIIDLISTRLNELKRSEPPLMSRVRHRRLLESAVEDLGQASDRGKPLELVADDLRSVSERLGRLSGTIATDDLLDAIFSEFCIGK